ncbi:TlpA family protein disulfide reductase [Candidatus Woesearchaeota archaeon]|nr:TlpA family protein disulfide reductase [Candidatus Woesearchaeota archaeon]
MKLLIFALPLIVFVYGCSASPAGSAGSPALQEEVPAAEPAVSGKAASQQLWLTAELKDVATGEKFSIAGFDKPVLIENFAVWCPVCLRQQLETRKLHSLVGDSVVSVSIDTDPNEDAAKVRSHIESNGFDWYYAVSPVDVTNSLIDTFGIDFTQVPLAPMALYCNGQHHELRRGVKSAEELKESIETLCA